MSKPVVLVDVDGVVADLHLEWLARYNRDYGDTLEPSDIKDWAIEKFVKEECGSRIFDYLWDEDLYDDVPVIEGAFLGVTEIRAMGARVVYCTASNPVSAAAKMRWLDKNSFLDMTKPAHARWRDIIIASDKARVRADVLIDDYVENFRGAEYAPVLFPAPYNAGRASHIPGIGWCPRADDWPHVVEIVGKKLNTGGS